MNVQPCRNGHSHLLPTINFHRVNFGLWTFYTYSSFTEPEFFLDVVLVWSIASLFRYKVGLINQIRSSLAITILYMYRTNFTYGVWFWSENWCILVSFHCSTCEGWYYILAITNLITLLSITIKQYGVGVFMV